ncbi:hypothetical protein [Neptuniibacter sp. QD37_11]|uniref:hypothetical protein n=1 Tax=Neptuniibacter sp. QD37_11 TaxID=3398209 RepID=UPI0039F49B17
MNNNTDIDWKLLISNAMDNLTAEGYSKKLYRRGFELDLSSDLLDEILGLLPEGYDAAQEYKKYDLAIVDMATREVVVVIECKCQIFHEKKQIESQIADLKKRDGAAPHVFGIMWTAFINSVELNSPYIDPKYFNRSKKGMQRKETQCSVIEKIEQMVGKVCKQVFYDDPLTYRGYNISILGTLVGNE